MNRMNKGYIETYTHPASMDTLVKWIEKHITQFNHTAPCNCMNCDAEKFDFFQELVDDFYAGGVKVYKQMNRRHK